VVTDVNPDQLINLDPENIKKVTEEPDGDITKL
jgi:hypothetical protein